MSKPAPPSYRTTNWRADNAAQDADDRFVFRTTDATLWFDPDGKGGAVPVLVADLQAGATMAAGDIELF